MSKRSLSLWKILLNRVSERPRRLTCEECFALITHFADMLLRGQRPAEVEKRARRHLQHCPDCREQHEQRLQALLAAHADLAE